jgi:hypothetical protein
MKPWLRDCDARDLMALWWWLREVVVDDVVV